MDYFSPSEGLAVFECVESKISFNRCLRQGSVEGPRLRQKMAMQLLAKVEEDWVLKGNRHLFGLGMAEGTSDLKFHVADNFWIMSRPKSDVEQMLKDLIQEAEEWDLAPKPACLW